MNIIVGREAAEKLRDRFIVLELETLKEGGDGKFTAYCVIPAEKVNIQDIAKIEQYIILHDQMIKELHKKNESFVLDAIGYLRGQFGGEADSFYDHIKEQLTK